MPKAPEQRLRESVHPTAPTDAQIQSQIVNFLWAIAELLRDAFKKNENQNVILPFTVLRRLDYALEPTKKKMIELDAKLKKQGLENRHDVLCRASGCAFYNVCPLKYDAILDDPGHLKRNLQHCIAGFSENVPLRESVNDYFRREVLPHVPDAWINPNFCDEKDQEIGKVGYEINFNRYFYQYQPPRPLAVIGAEIREVEKDILAMLKEVMA